MFVVLEIVPSTLIEHLTQDFDGRLSSVLLNQRHVEIINEDDNLFAHTSAKDTSTSLFKSTINDILNLIAASLSRETDFDEMVFCLITAIELVHEHILNVDRFTCSGRSHKECRDLIKDAELLDEAVANSIDGCDNDFLDSHVFWEVVDLILVCIVHPVLPLVSLDFINVVIDCTSIELCR